MNLDEFPDPLRFGAAERFRLVLQQLIRDHRTMDASSIFVVFPV
jgi:hypothetical protein